MGLVSEMIHCDVHAAAAAGVGALEGGGQGDGITERRREAEKRFDEICVKG